MDIPVWRNPPKDGNFDILQYGAFALNTRGGANFSVLYNDGVVAPRTDYDWVQFADPTNWGSNDSKPFVDSTPPNSNTSPFYDSYTRKDLPTGRTPTTFFGNAIWLDTKNYPQQKIQNPAGGGKVPAGDLLLVDNPWCLYTCLKDDVASKINFDTFLVTFTAPAKNTKGTVMFLDGFHWGVQIIGECAKPPGPAPVQESEQCVIPEPPAVLLLAIGCLGIAIGMGGFRHGCASRRRRTSQRPRTV